MGGQVEYDVDAATTYKAEHDARIKEKEDQVNALTGKDNKKARTEMSKEVSAMKIEEKYVDACKVVKGLAPPKGNFIKNIIEGEPGKKITEAASTPAPTEEKKEIKKKDDKPKKAESAGISKAERDELEQLKKDIIERKAALKAEGLSGGQCNKDEKVVTMVARMT